MRATLPRLFAVRLVGACLAMTMLHACQQYGTDGVAVSTSNREEAMASISLDRDASPSDVAAANMQCAAIGGVLEQAGRMGRYACYAQYADGGKSCRDSDDCAGDCRADPEAKTGGKAVGICTANNIPFGCYAKVENGVVGPFICVD